MKGIENIVLIGTGNVSWHLGHALVGVGKNITQVFGRNKENANLYAQALHAEAISDVTKLDATADLYLICVNDSSIEKVESQLVQVNGVVAHTSGSIHIGKRNKNNGVFYPLQTFSKDVSVNFSNLPILVEGKNEEVTLALENLAKEISQSVFRISSAQRENLHVAAVFANNFSNYMFAQAYNICKENGVPFQTLYALITETARKAIEENPNLMQTGPAVRKDEKTIAKHLSFLQEDQKELYNVITKSIIKAHETKL